MEEPIAIIGMGCRFPGGVTDTDSYWKLLVNRTDAITPMPPGRYNVDHYYDPTLATSGKVITREGGFLQDVDRFDADFFHISAFEAPYIDPQQRLLLEVAWEALESGGMVPSALAGSNTGVFVGMWLNDYEDMIYNASDDVELHTTLGVGRYPASGRLSYLFDFRGPSLTLDTACSSGLVSVHLACQSLQNGESDMALAGAANVILQPQISIAYSRAGMLSPDARCKFGDASANGYVRSDGAAVLVLKRLSDALRDGDPIRAIIRGSAVNNDGHAGDSLVTPSPAGQIEMLREAYRAAGVQPGLVGYVEAHGTGTRVGDPIELGALGTVLGEGRPAGMPCWVGSVKSNIGHTESVSGIAGLMKAALCLEHGKIPPSLHFHQPNPGIPWSDIPLRIPTETVAWPAQASRRYAGVSSFGVTGTNAHVVLEAAPETDSPAATTPPAADFPYILPLSAHRPEALAELAGKYRAFLTDGAGELADIGYSAAVRRAHHGVRAAFVGRSKAEVAEQIAAWDGAAGEATPRRIVFVFPGQGGQWRGMGRQLMDTEPVFRATIERCDAAMRPYLDFSLAAMLAIEETDDYFENIDVIQPAIFAVQAALADLWRAKGIVPDAVIGHSMGEAAAAYTAGVLSLDDAARVICLRSQLMRRVSGRGAMAVVELSLDEARAALAGHEDSLSVAVNNAPRSVVISGDAGALETVISRLQAQDVFCRRVKVDVAAHSPHMDALRPELVAALVGIEPQAHAVRIYSTVTGAARDGVDFDADYWGHNLREPVMFSAAVQQALGDGCNTFVEIGPHPVLLPAIERGLSDYGLDPESIQDVALIETMRRDDDQLQVMAQAVGRLYAAGGEVDWQQFYPGGQLVPLPSYPWQRERYWVDVDPDAFVRKSAQPAAERPWRGWLYEPRWEPVELPAADMPPGAWLIFADERGIGDSLAERLVSAGHAVTVVHHGEHFSDDGSGRLTAHPMQPGDFDRVLAAVPGQPRGIVYCWAASLQAGMDMAAEELEAGQQAALGGLLHLAQSLTANRRSIPIWMVTQGAQGTGGAVNCAAPAQAAVWGLGRVIREEHPDLWGGLIDLDGGSSDEAFQAIWNELGARDGEDQLAYRAGQRHALRLVRAEPPEAAAAYAFRSDGTYLITGGLGDIGSRLARWMVGQGARRLILMGRTKLPPRSQWREVPVDSSLGQKIAAVRDLEALGASVHLAAVDVADEADLRAYLEGFERDGWPPVVGVIHAAGLLDVHLLQQMDWTVMNRALRPKVFGGWLLHRLLPDVELFVNFSSINALLGLPGQGNYAAANAFLDGLAAYRQALGLHGLSINWAVWEGMGYASTQTGAGSSGQLAEQGIQGFAAEQGVQAFGDVVGWKAATITVVPADWQQYQQTRSRARQFPMLRRLLEETPAVRTEHRAAPANAMVERLAAADAANRLTLIGDYLQGLAAQILRVSAARIKRDAPLGSHGMNSLMGMELRNRLERDLGVTLSATLVWNYPTIELMSAFLAQKMGLALESAPETTAAAGGAAESPPVDDLIAGLGKLSDDDILKELMGKP